MNRKYLPILLLVVLFSAVLFSCKKSKNTSPNADKTLQYFPLQKGKYIVYNVDSTLWIDTSCLEYHHTYQLRYQVTDTFTDDQQNVNYVVDAFVNSAKTGGQWVASDVFNVAVTPDGLVVDKDRIKFIKLVFPVVNGTTFNGNKLIDTRDTDYAYFRNWTYSYQNVGQSFTSGLESFDNTVTVAEHDETVGDMNAKPDSLASRTYFKEVYAYNVGLIYSQQTHWTYDPNFAMCKKGYSVIMQAVSHN